MVHSVLQVEGSVGSRCVTFLLDSGAAVSVIDQAILPQDIQHRIDPFSAETIGANGMPLDVVGHVPLEVTLGEFQQKQDFVVVRNLSVDCLLGADFLFRHGAVVDCTSRRLSLAGTEIPIISHSRMSSDQSKPVTCIVCLPKTIEVPGRTVQLIPGKLSGSMDPGVRDGLVEALDSGGVPKHLLVARTLSQVSPDTEVIVQVVNTGPEALKLYKGTRIGQFTSRKYILQIGESTQCPSSQCDGSDHIELPVEDIDINKSDITDKQQQELLALLNEYKDIFVSESGALGKTSLVRHSIVTEGMPIRQPLRRVPVATKGVIQSEVQRMLDRGVIRPSNSPWSSPVVLVRKPDGSWRFCVDFRKLNSVTHKDAYPLPRIDETLESLGGAVYFTTLDLASGYWQVELQEIDKEKTAFSTANGHYEFNVMPFGLTNAPATFQRLMECVLAGLTMEECLIYIDDIIVFGASFEQHLARLRRVLQQIREAGMKLKPRKCHFLQREVKYLGHVVSSSGIQADPAKLEAVTTYPVPRDVKELRTFLGLSNYYRRYIKGYSETAEPLHQLTRKTAKGFHWNFQCQQAFDVLKAHLVNPPILAYPQFDASFKLQTDASNVAIGAVLSQEQDGSERVIAYWSRQLQKAERNYSVIEREALAAVAAIREFYPYLYGFHFKLVTDHNPLVSLKGLKDVGGRLTRWALFLQQFDFEVVHRPGREHGNADALSRRPLLGEDLVTTIQDVWMLGDISELREAQAADIKISNTIKAISLGNPPNRRTCLRGNFFIQNGVLCRKFRESRGASAITQIVLPSPLRSKVLSHLHSGHLGVKRTLEKVKERFYWPSYVADVECFVRECEQCQRRNPPNPLPRAPFETIKANHPFQIVTWDIMGPLPTSETGFKYILVVTDVFTKWVEAFPLKSTGAETLATVFVDEVVSRFGVPSQLHSDQGANFCSAIIDAMCRQLGIERSRTTAYHPQGNGQVERFNRTLESMLAKVVNDNQKDWDKHLPRALFAYRTSLHETTKFTPFFLNFGRSPSLPVDIMLGRKPQEEDPQDMPQYVQQLQQSLRNAFTLVRHHLDLSHRRSKEHQYGGTAHAAEDLRIGDRVWLFVPAVKTGRTKKLASLWRGPYTVIDKLSPVNYRIQLIGTTKSLVVHRNRLKLCYGNPNPRVQPPRKRSQPSTIDPNQNVQTAHHRPPNANANRPMYMTRSSPGGYTSSSDIQPAQATRDSADSGDVQPTQATGGVQRPRRNRRQPDRYGEPIPH